MDQVDKVSFRISEADQVTTAGMVDQFLDSTGVRQLQCPAPISILNQASRKGDCLLLQILIRLDLKSSTQELLRSFPCIVNIRVGSIAAIPDLIVCLFDNLHAKVWVS